MTEYEIINGNLVKCHEHDFKLYSSDLHVDIPIGNVRIPVICKVCKLEGYRYGFFDGRNFSESSFEILNKEDIDLLELDYE